MNSNRKVAYFYDNKIGSFNYGEQHPMKPIRIKMAHQLIVNYGLYRKMEVYEPHWATKNEMVSFHNSDYIDYLDSLKTVEVEPSSKKFNIGETDCPFFSGILDFSQISAGASIDAARLINAKEAEIAINWGGGLHHAKKVEACGFCYVNDIVLCMLELLRNTPRILYIDIDVHHGDGVEEAFYLSNRAMTLSFHRYGDFFPGTGSILEVGKEDGENYSLNVPLKKGITDDYYVDIFKRVTQEVLEVYRPGAIVLQCGADSLSYDKLGDFCLTLDGHGACVDFVKQSGIPFVMLGGGGYTVANVARCWTNETALVLGETLDNDLPVTDYYSNYGPDYHLNFKAANHPNLNDETFLANLLEYSIENIKKIDPRPNVKMNTEMFSPNPMDEMQSDKIDDREDPREY